MDKLITAGQKGEESHMPASICGFTYGTGIVKSCPAGFVRELTDGMKPCPRKAGKPSG
ncbi:MAG: hypothetical protein SPE66_02700 [Bilifractor sp.]|nr:hypothetical protein [Bilifractor sp.]